MELETKPDLERSLRRMEAFWDCEVLDRAFAQIIASKPEQKPYPASTHATLRERWMDAEYAVTCALARAENLYWGGDAIPTFSPNLGPEIMTTGFGAELDFSDHTSWSHPILTDWAQVASLRFDPQSPYIAKIQEMTRLGVERGRGRFITGLTDIHPGGDLAASLRNPQDFCMDLLESPDEVEHLLQTIQPAYADFYDLLYAILREGGQTLTTTWLPFCTNGRFYVPSNDFSCMISSAQFERFFLARLAEEIEFLDRSIYHLDGPNALHHLPAILSIPKLNAVQWVYGAGHGPARRWIPVYKQIQAAGKGLQICDCTMADLDDIFANLRPEGVALTGWTNSVAEADAMIARIARWR